MVQNIIFFLKKAIKVCYRLFWLINIMYKKICFCMSELLLALNLCSSIIASIARFNGGDDDGAHVQPRYPMVNLE